MYSGIMFNDIVGSCAFLLKQDTAMGLEHTAWRPTLSHIGKLGSMVEWLRVCLQSGCVIEFRCFH